MLEEDAIDDGAEGLALVLVEPAGGLDDRRHRDHQLRLRLAVPADPDTNGAGAQVGYGYDLKDQLQTFSDSQGPLSYGYQYARTGAGQTLAYGCWDQANRLLSYQDSQDPTHNSVYTYNGDGLRLKNQVNGVDSVQSWDMAGGAAPAAARADRFCDRVLDHRAWGPAAGDGRRDGTSYYYHSDKLGSTRALSKDDGTVAATYDYDAYGSASQTGFLQPFQFAGQYTDAESGLLYLRARYYDGSAAAFVTRDPITARTRQPYVYAQDSPVNGVDPSGLVVGGVCGNISWQFVVAIHASACALVGFHTDTHQVSFGFSQTVTTPGENGVPNAVGTPSMGAGYGGEFSWDAQDVSQMSNSFVYAGGSAAGFSGEYFASTPGGSCPVHGIAFGRSYGTPWPEVHGGISETVVEKVGWPPQIIGVYT